MKLKFVFVLSVMTTCFWACESDESGSNPKQLLDAAQGEEDKMKVLDNLSLQLQGIWRSDDDKKSELRIQGDKFTSVYDGKEVSKERLMWYIQCPTICSQGQDSTKLLCFTLENELRSLCFNLVNLSKEKLSYSQLPGTGNTLSYTKIMDIPKQGTPEDVKLK